MSTDYCEYVVEMLQDWHPVVARRMFGGYGLYRAGQIFGLIIDDALYFKTDETTRSAYETAGSAPFVYEARGKPVALSYWQAPAELFDDAHMLASWADAAYQVGLRHPPKHQKRKPKNLY